MTLSTYETVKESIIMKIIHKLDPTSKQHIIKAIHKATNTTNKKDLEKLSLHPHFAVRLCVAKNCHTTLEVLEQLSNSSEEYRSVANEALKNIKNLTKN